MSARILNFIKTLQFHVEISISWWNMNFIMKFEFHDEIQFLRIFTYKFRRRNSNFMMKLQFHDEIIISWWNQNSIMKLQFHHEISSTPKIIISRRVMFWRCVFWPKCKIFSLMFNVLRNRKRHFCVKHFRWMRTGGQSESRWSSSGDSAASFSREWHQRAEQSVELNSY